MRLLVRWGRSAAVRGVVLMALALGASLAMDRTSAALDAPTSVFTFDDAVGGFAQGQADLLATPEATFVAGTPWDIGPPITITEGAEQFTVVASGVDRAALEAGTRHETVHFAAPGKAVFWLQTPWGGGFVTGSFTVHDVAYAPDGSFARLSLSYASDGLIGELRFASASPAIGAAVALSRYAPYGAFEDTLVGEASPGFTFTLTNVGTTVLHPRARPLAGHTDDFEILSDACDRIDLARGASCSMRLRFTPTASGWRSASAGWTLDVPSGHRELLLVGRARWGTTTSITAPTGWTWDPVPMTVTVDPVPGGGETGMYLWFRVVGEPGLDREVLGDAKGRFLVPLPQGDHEVYAWYQGSDEWAASRSETVLVRVGTSTDISLSFDQENGLSSQTPTITARLRPADVVIGGGQLTIHDLDSDTLLGTITVTADQRALTITPILPAGRRTIGARFDGYRRFGPSSQAKELFVEADTVVHATVNTTISPFYPVKDGYRDLLEIHGSRAEVVDAVVEIRATGSQAVVRSWALPPDTGSWERDWDGRRADGTRAPSGTYVLTSTLTDVVGNEKVVSRQIELSWDRLTWTTRSVILDGRAFVLVARSNGGTVSTGRSGYAGGVKIASNSGVAGVQYRFKVTPGAAAYRTLSFAAYGRSTNKHKAVIGIWNPDLGSYRKTDSFDAVKVVGPGAAWWSTSTAIAGRVRDGAVRAVVMVAKGLGGSGSSVFDIRDVRITYQTGALQAMSEAELDAIDAETGDPAVTDEVTTPDGSVDGRKGQIPEGQRFDRRPSPIPDRGP